MNNNEEIRKELDLIDIEVNCKVDVNSPQFSQISFDFSEIVSRCGKLYSRAKANLKSQEVEFEHWEALQELNIRSYYENLSSANKLLNEKSKGERVTEGKIKAEVKCHPDYKIKQLEIVEAERLIHLSEKAMFDASKLRGYISQAIINNRKDS